MIQSAEVNLKLEELNKWFEENPKLPQEIHPMLLKRFFKCMKGDVDETKKLIELNYSLRNKHPHIFLNRDPEEPILQRCLAARDLIPLPGLTPERYKILLYRLIDHDYMEVTNLEENKIALMIADCRFTILDLDREDEINADGNEDKDEDDANADEDEDSKNDLLDCLAEGDVQIVDMSGITMGHMARVSFSVARAVTKYMQEAHPTRLRAMHLINSPSYLNKMLALIKPFLNDEVLSVIHVHHAGLDSLYEQVPRDMLPEEYGGKAGKLADLKVKWLQLLSDKRDYLMDTKQWKVEQHEQQRRWLWW